MYFDRNPKLSPKCLARGIMMVQYLCTYKGPQIRIINKYFSLKRKRGGGISGSNLDRTGQQKTVATPKEH